MWFDEENCYQHESELQAVTDLLTKAYDVSLDVILEIGTFRGGTAAWWAQLAKEKVVCVDLNFNFDGIVQSYRKEHSFHLCPVVEVKGDSSNPETKEKVLEALDGDLADLLYIDGDHFLGPCRMDFRMYAPLVRPGGWILFHDIVNTASQTPFFWDEIKDKYVSYEFVYQRQPIEYKKTSRDPLGPAGLGLIRWWGRFE